MFHLFQKLDGYTTDSWSDDTLFVKATWCNICRRFRSVIDLPLLVSCTYTTSVCQNGLDKASVQVHRVTFNLNSNGYINTLWIFTLCPRVLHFRLGHARLLYNVFLCMWSPITRVLLQGPIYLTHFFIANTFTKLQRDKRDLTNGSHRTKYYSFNRCEAVY